MVKKKVTTTTVVEEIIDDGKKRPFHATILVDNSSSMGGWQERVAKGANEYAATLAATAKKEGFDATISFVLFSGGYVGNLNMNVVRDKIPAGSWRPLEASEIVPNGNTPLYDAVDRSLTMISELKGTDKALVVITDGEENSSKVSPHAVKAKIEAFQKAGHVMIYLGANQDAWATGGSMGTSFATTSTYTMDNFNIAFNNASMATTRYATTRSADSANFTADETASMTGKTASNK